MQLGEFFIALGFDVDDQKLKNFNEDIKNLGKDFLKISAVAAGAVYAVNAFVSGGVEAATALRNFNAETGNSIDMLQKWQVGATLTNASISADQVTASFHAMANAIADVTMGKGPVGSFSMLGISDVRGMDTGDLMEELRSNFDRNVNEWGLPQTINLMKDIGFDPGMLQALKMTRKEFDNIVGGKILDPESRERLVKLGDAISKFKWDFKLFKDQMSAEIAPKLIEFIDKAIPMMKDFGDSLMAVGSALKNLWNDLDEDWQNSMKVIALGLTAMFAPVTAMFVALAAAIWDVGRALRGVESFTGKSMLWLLNLMQSEEGSKVAEWKKSLEASGNGKAERIVPKGGIGQKSDLMRIYEEGLNPNSANQRMMDRIRNNQETNMNNIWNIQNAGDNLDLANLIIQRQTQMLSNAMAEQNNGSRF